MQMIVRRWPKLTGYLLSTLFILHTVFIGVSAVPVLNRNLGLEDSSYLSTESWTGFTVELILAVCVWLLFRSSRRRRGESSALGVVAGLGFVSFILGLVSYLPCPGGQAAFFTSVSQSLSLFLGAYDNPFGALRSCPSEPPLALQIARLGAISAVGVGIASALSVLFRAQLDRFLIRTASDLNIVIGFNPESGALVSRIAQNISRRQRLAMFIDGEGPEIVPAHTCVMKMPLDDPSVVPVGRVRGVVSAIFLLSSDPSQVLRQYRECKSQLAGTSVSPITVLRIDNVWQAEHWRRELVSAQEPWLVDVISSFEQTGRSLARRLVERGVDRVAIVGSSQLRLALASELALWSRECMITRAGSIKVPEIVFVGGDSENARDQYHLMQSRFGNLAAAQIDVRDPSDRVFVDIFSHSRQPAVVYTEDIGSAASALGASHPDWTIFAMDPSATGVSPNPVMGSLFPFNTEIAWDEESDMHVWDRAARIIHTNYLFDNGLGSGPAAVPWAALSKFYRDSNLRLVRTVLKSATAVGRSWGTSAGEIENRGHGVPEHELLEMARLEHMEWMAHYERNGWVYGPFRDELRKRHDRILPWDELDDIARGRTLQGVVDALQVLAVLGYRSVDPFVSGSEIVSEYRRTGEVNAVQLENSWHWESEGGASLLASPGDWKVSDDCGQEWSVRDEEFKASYEPVAPGRWRRIGIVKARPASNGEIVRTLEGRVVAQEESWVVESPTGARWVVPAQKFESNYESLGNS